MHLAAAVWVWTGQHTWPRWRQVALTLLRFTHMRLHPAMRDPIW